MMGEPARPRDDGYLFEMACLVRFQVKGESVTGIAEHFNCPPETVVDGIEYAAGLVGMVLRRDPRTEIA